MRKKRSRKNHAIMFEESDFEDSRPTTANLEAPLVLDPRLVNKLDMSLLTKESLSASLIRISLETTSTLTTAVTTIDTVTSKSIDQSSSMRPCFMTVVNSSLNPESKIKIPEDRNNFEIKRLDCNNNKTKTVKHSQRKLLPVCSRSSQKLLNLSNEALFSIDGDENSMIKKKSKYYRTYGLSLHSEYFHTHSKNEMTSHIKLPFKTNSKTEIPIEAKIPVTSSKNYDVSSLNCEKQIIRKSSGISMTEENAFNKELVKERKINSLMIPKLQEGKLTELTVKRRPRRVTCYICGREFGTASFPIHEPKCLQKWQCENKLLPSSQRRSIPQRPNLPIDHEDWNNAAWKQSQALLIPCRKCKRTFLPDRLAIHSRNCRV